MSRDSGIEVLKETEGTGIAAEKDDRVEYNVRIFLNRGDEVPLNEEQMKYARPEDTSVFEDGRVLINHRTVLGKRQAIAGIEKSLYGMKAGGYRRIKVSPHLAYRAEGVPGLIPPNAVLTVEIWVRNIER